MPLAYSYLRYSSPQQSAGDSIRRQMEDTAAWCQRNGAQLDGSLCLRDEGVSAFKGKNRENPDVHGLAMFLQAVKTGRVPAGSYLVLENLDRLTRENIVPAVNLFTGILLAGVRVVQLRPSEQVFAASADMTSIMLALVELSRGNSESQMKSVRVGGAWAKKRANAATKIVSRRVPGWIRHEGDRLTLDPDGAETVRRVFALARDGLGVRAVAQKLNADGVPVLGRTKFKGRPVAWSETVVYHMLTARSVIGEYQPCKGRGSDRQPCGDPIADYYPPAVDADTYHAVQGILKRRSAVGRGRRGKHINLFAGLLIDATDGGSLTYKHLKSRAPSIIPVGAKHGRGTRWSSFLAKPFEACILSKLAEVKASDVRGDDDAGRRVEALSGRLAEVEQLMKAWQAKMDNPAIVDTVAEKLADLNGKRKTLAAKLADAQRDAASPAAEAWGTFVSLADLMKADPSDELRLKVRAALRRCIEGVYCVFATSGRNRVAGVQVRFVGSDRQRSYLMWYDRFTHGRPSGDDAQVRSEAWGDADDDLDLRRRKDAKALEKLLAEADLPTL